VFGAAVQGALLSGLTTPIIAPTQATKFDKVLADFSRKLLGGDACEKTEILDDDRQPALDDDGKLKIKYQTCSDENAWRRIGVAPCGTELRVRSTVVDGELRIEGARILPTAWCAEAGSVFAIDTVLTDVAVPSLPAQVWYRLVRALLYDDVRFVIWPTVGGAAIGIVVSLLVRRSGRGRRAS
jgi:hypothetical protein